MYSADGFALRDVEVEGEIPTIEKGVNRVSFNCKTASNLSQKVKVKIALVGGAG